jgi:uncharacterized tellurite resistance protein B-like protein
MEPIGFKDILTRLYTMLMWSDGHFVDKDFSFIRKMSKVVGLDQESFLAHVKLLAIIPREELVYDTITAIRQLPWDEQVLCVAWLCAIANWDGRIDETEWRIIYQIYHKELHLPLKEIIKTQNWLAKSLLQTDVF